MSEPLDTNGMVLALTDGVGASFGAATWKSFKAQLERLERQLIFQKAPYSQQQSLIDLLAIAAFYQNVIVPIESSGSFIEVLNKAGATHLRVANDKLDKRFANASRSTAQTFRQVISKSEIPEHLLTYATMNQFASAAIRNYSGGKQ
jgi:hypothetical protein